MIGAEFASDFEIRRVQAIATDLELAKDVLHRLALSAVAFVDLGLDEIVGGDDHVDLTTQREAQVLRRLRDSTDRQAPREVRSRRSSRARRREGGRCRPGPRPARPRAASSRAGPPCSAPSSEATTGQMSSRCWMTWKSARISAISLPLLLHFRENVLGERAVNETAVIGKVR